MSKYNGHKNWNHWNVSLWINNDEHLYRMAQRYCRFYTRLEAATEILKTLSHDGITHTPDGAPYSISSIRSALVGI
jgi:hypothetical protein